jgi:hypothetical protein
MPPGEEVFKFHGYSGPCPKPPLPKQETELDRMRKDAARYSWLVGKVFCRGETCLALYEEFGGAPIKGETIRQFMDRYIDEAMTANARVEGRDAASSRRVPSHDGLCVKR